MPALRVFVNDVNSFHGAHLVRKLQEDGHSVIGTMCAKDPVRTNFLADTTVDKILQVEKVDVITQQELPQRFGEIDAFIYCIFDEQAAKDATFIVQELASMPEASGDRTFVCVSTAMTWANTKWDRDDEGAVLTEELFRKRKAHPNYALQLATEKLVFKLGKKANLRTFVAAAGLIYGNGEDLLHNVFRDTWEGSLAAVPIIGKGYNSVPCVHVADYANIVSRLVHRLDDFDEDEDRYILVVDSSSQTQADIMRSIAQELGNGKVQRISKDNNTTALSHFGSQHLVDLLSIDVRLKSVITPDFDFDWHCRNGFVARRRHVIKEFRTMRSLTPLKIFVTGPPASGKSSQAAVLADHYNIPHLVTKDVIDEVLANSKSLREQVAEAKQETQALLDEYLEEERIAKEEADRDSVRGDGDNDDDDDDARAAANDPDADDKPRPDPSRIPDAIMAKIFRRKLRSRSCRNQGYILDGFPKSFEQAALLFALGDPQDDMEPLGSEQGDNDHRNDENGDAHQSSDEFDDEDELPLDEEPDEVEEDDYGVKVDASLLPEYVVYVDGDEEIMRNRILALPEKQVAGTHNTEEGFMRRLKLFRRSNDPDTQPLLSFLDEHDALVIYVDVESDTNMACESHIRTIGIPHNYGPSKAEIEAQERSVQEALTAKQEVQEAQVKEKDRLEEESRRQQESIVAERLREIQSEEHRVQEVLSMPLRQYMMDNVMPVLTEGLLEVCKLRPNDGIDHLAEYLFRHNPIEDPEIEL